MKNKIDSLIGFAVKARKVVYGTDNIETRKIALIICCKSLGENSLKRMKKISENTKTPLVISHFPLENIVYKQGVKAIAITDKQMSQAIINFITTNSTDDYEFVGEEKPV